MTYTYAILGVSRAVYDEIAALLRKADYHHAFHDDSDGDGVVIDMHGIALRRSRGAAVSHAEVLETDISIWKDRANKLQRWVNDLQSGMYINCVYCGHRYGPNGEVSASMADVLKEHVMQCPAHPMSTLRAAIDEIAGQKLTTELEEEGDVEYGYNEIIRRARKALADIKE